MFEGLAKVRDNLYGAATALDELIQKKSKVVLKECDPEKIKWEDRTNPEKGPFQATEDVNNLDFKALRQALADHNGFLRMKGYQYWVYQNGTTIARRSLDQKKTESQPTTAKPTSPSNAIEKVKAVFPQELANMLMFTETQDNIEIRPRQYLGSENFAKIASIVRGEGGEYISAGKESHFRIKKA